MALRVLRLALPFRCETENLEIKIAISSPIIKFGGWFFAQIVENRETRLSSLFLGPGDLFFFLQSCGNSGRIGKRLNREISSEIWGNRWVSTSMVRIDHSFSIFQFCEGKNRRSYLLVGTGGTFLNFWNCMYSTSRAESSSTCQCKRNPYQKKLFSKTLIHAMYSRYSEYGTAVRPIY
jgi:hypothetical protein